MQSRQILKVGTVVNSIEATALLGLMLVLVGCGAATPSASTATGPSPTAQQAIAIAKDACGLISEKDATSAIGADPGVGQLRTAQGAQACEFSGHGLFLQVGLNTNQTPALVEQAKSRITPGYQQSGSSIQEIPGVGDVNFVVSSGHGGACYVLKGSILGHVTLVSPVLLAAPAESMISLCRAVALNFTNAG